MIDGAFFLNMCTVQYFIIQYSITEQKNAFLFRVLRTYGHHVNHDAPSYWMYKNRTFKKTNCLHGLVRGDTMAISQTYLNQD